MTRPPHAVAPQSGFTLIEAVIAVIILAIAAATLLPRARGLLDYAERARRHYAAVGNLLDRAALLPTVDLKRAEIGRGRDSVTVRPADSADAPPIVVSNVSVGGTDVPIGDGPAPFQYLSFDGTLGHGMVLISPALIVAKP